MDAGEFTFVIIHIRVDQTLLGLAAAVLLSSGSRLAGWQYGYQAT